MTAYYNEHDPFAAAWLRELITARHIAPGVVDERSIEDVTPSDLAGFNQCHFFAGIGVWSYALRLAGWPDDRPVWTGSCPCQPFSAAGKGAGFTDERHLWPAFFHLISQCQPPAIFGEQVASKAVDSWIDLVHADMEGLGYAFGSVPFPSAGVGAPHIRDRNFWVADAAGNGRGCGKAGTIKARPATGRNAEGQTADKRGELQAGLEGPSSELFGGVADTDGSDKLRIGGSGRKGVSEADGRWRGVVKTDGRVPSIGLANASEGERRGRPDDGALQLDGFACGRDKIASDAERDCTTYTERPSPTNGFWRDADWLFCRDGKWRPVEPGTFPLAHGAAARVGRLRGYGNAINAEAAKTFIGGYLT